MQDNWDNAMMPYFNSKMMHNILFNAPHAGSRGTGSSDEKQEQYSTSCIR